MKLKNYTKSMFGIVLALVLAATSPVPESRTVTAEEKGGITLEAPQDEQNKYVDLGDMSVTAYRILDEEDGMFTVNSSFTDFFGTAADYFYDNADIFIQDGSPKPGVQMYITYDGDANHLKLNSENPQDDSIITVSTDQLKTLVGNVENREYFAAALMSAILGEGTPVKEGSAVLTNTSNTKILSGWLRRYIDKKGNISGKEAGVTEGSDPETEPDKIKFSNLDFGYWILLASKVPANVANVETIFRLAKNYPDGEPASPNINAQLKLETQGIEKQVANLADDPSGENMGDSAVAQVGDVLKYEAKMKIPDLSDYDGSLVEPGEKYIFRITDTMVNQQLADQTDAHNVITNEKINEDNKAFALNAFDIKIKYSVVGESEKTVSLKDIAEAGGEEKILADMLTKAPEIEGATKASDYGNYTEQKQTFVLDFDVEMLRSLQESVGFIDKENWKGAELTLTYYTRLTSDAVLRNGNEVSLKYSNDPHTAGDAELPPSKTTVYSYGIDLLKTFEKDDGGDVEYGSEEYKKLANEVVFNIYSAKTLSADQSKAEEWNNMPLSVTGIPGDYAVADKDNAEAGSSDIRLDETGHIKIRGLKEGFYKLVETKAPGGYAKIKEIVVHIVAQDPDAILYDEDGVEVYEGNLSIEFTTDNASLLEPSEDSENYIHFTVKDMRGINLPDTGDVGFWSILIAGVLMVTIAVALLFSQRKKKSA